MLSSGTLSMYYEELIAIVEQNKIKHLTVLHLQLLQITI